MTDPREALIARLRANPKTAFATTVRNAAADMLAEDGLRIAQLEAERDSADWRRGYRMLYGDLTRQCDQWRRECERLRAALALEHKTRKDAQRYVGSLPAEVGQWFENHMAEADRMTARALAAATELPEAESQKDDRVH